MSATNNQFYRLPWIPNETYFFNHCVVILVFQIQLNLEFFRYNSKFIVTYYYKPIKIRPPFALSQTMLRSVSRLK